MLVGNMMAQAWKVVKPHVPLIKFRKGGPTNAAKPSSNGPSSVKVESKSKPSNIEQRPVIEDWQLPPRYKRLTIDEKEINAINSGGAN